MRYNLQQKMCDMYFELGLFLNWVDVMVSPNNSICLKNVSTTNNNKCVQALCSH